eukprot:10228599-Alexandrium_andersonii.AAC.1
MANAEPQTRPDDSTMPPAEARSLQRPGRANACRRPCGRTGRQRAKEKEASRPAKGSKGAAGADA